MGISEVNARVKMNRIKTNILPRLAQKSCRNFGVSTILAKKRTIPEDWLPVHLRDEAISANLISTRGVSHNYLKIDKE